MCCCTNGSSSSSTCNGCCLPVPLEGAWPVIHKDLYWLLLLLLRPARLAAAQSPVDLSSICLLLLLPFLVSRPAITFPIVFLDLLVHTCCCLLATAVAVLLSRIISAAALVPTTAAALMLLRFAPAAVAPCAGSSSNCSRWGRCTALPMRTLLWQPVITPSWQCITPVAGRLAILAAAAVPLLLVGTMTAAGQVAIPAVAALLLLGTMPAAEVAEVCRSAAKASWQCIVPAAGVVAIPAAAVLLLVGTMTAQVAEVRRSATRAAWFKVHVDACCCCCCCCW
jgi:hypothetical protein